MKRCLFQGLALAAFSLAMASPLTKGATIDSAPFSFGLGYTANVSNFDDTETSSVNTPTTIGNFSFTPSVTTDRWSSRGVTFVNRVLADGPADNDYSANIDTALFQLPVTASYNGPAPADAAAIPNYKLRLEITKVSIWAGAHSSSSLQSLAWDETTAGHAATSPSVALNNGGWDVIAGYTQAAWDPADFDQSLANLNDPYTRTFDILGGNALRYGDGIEVEGLVHLVYDAVPEPNTVSLIGLAMAISTLSRRRRAKKSTAEA
jgi:hypothetical protein